MNNSLKLVCFFNWQNVKLRHVFAHATFSQNESFDLGHKIVQSRLLLSFNGRLIKYWLNKLILYSAAALADLLLEQM